MQPELDIQRACTAGTQPSDEDFRLWAGAALAAAGEDRPCEISIRLVDAEESQGLNREYRGKDKPTNVLSFPSDLPDFVLEQLSELPLGDLVICVPVMAQEAQEQGKPETHHWAHLTIHGVLHLLGYDHIEEADASDMEALEVAVLATLGIGNPYEVNE